LRLLLTRPLDDSRRLAQALAAARHELLIEPLLSIETLAPGLDLEGVQALAVSSRHALGFLAGRDDAQAQGLRLLPLFAVGSATAEAARAAGFAQVVDADGVAGALAALLGERLDPEAGAVLHLAGESVAPALAEGLASRGIALRRVLAYRAREASQLTTVCRAALAAGQLDGATFLSPRTAAAFARLVLEARVAERCAGLLAFCLSVAVAKALDGVSWRRVVVAESPRRKDLIAAIAAAEQEERPSR
jgi:uroporphyrinogen-III synthase